MTDLGRTTRTNVYNGVHKISRNMHLAVGWGGGKNHFEIGVAGGENFFPGTDWRRAEAIFSKEIWEIELKILSY